jgi:hypothetical protein
MKSEYSLETRIKGKAQEMSKKKSDLEKVEADLHSPEKKWIAEQISFETYNRWHSDYTKQRNYQRAQIDQLGRGHNDTYTLLTENINWLKDMRHIYHTANLLQKQELIRTVFDNSLFYQDKVSIEHPT